MIGKEAAGLKLRTKISIVLAGGRKSLRKTKDITRKRKVT